MSVFRTSETATALPEFPEVTPPPASSAVVVPDEEDLPPDMRRTSRGLVRLVKTDPIKLQNASMAVKIPKPPTYTATTISGRVREMVMDAKAAEETEGGLEKWQTYQNELREAQGEQLQILIRTAFFYGVEFTPPDDGWEEELEFLGYSVPKDPQQRKTIYLMHFLKTEESLDLMQAALEYSATSEEAIAEKTRSFRR